MCNSARIFCCMYPPFLKEMKVQYFFSICKRIAIFDCPAINFRTLMCKILFFTDHLPLADIPLQKVSQPDFHATVCITKFGSFCLSDLSLLNLKFFTHQRSSCFDSLFNTISAWHELAWSNDYIYCCCKFFSYR